MKALFYPSFGQLIVNDQPLPECKDDEVLIRVIACGICGSELETFKNKNSRRKPPIIMGHEFSGVIAKKGTCVNGWEIGMRVVSNSVVSCGKCNRCKQGETNLCIHRQVFGMERNGAFAEYVNVPASCLVALPLSITFKEAALAEPLANGVHMVKLTSYLPINKVLIIGAGPIGLMAQQAFQTLRQASVIVADLKSVRLEVAKKLGAANVIDVHKGKLREKILEYIDDEDIDIVVDAVGTKDTQSEALHLARAGGTVILIGLHENSCSLHSYDIILPEKQVMGTYAATIEDIEQALQIMSNGKADVTSWVHYYSLSDGKKAFEEMRQGKDNHIKSVILT